MKAVHRNSACPCGSGRRYKHCCGRLAPDGPHAPDAADAGLSLRELMLAALGHQRAGRWRDAERLYRQALALVPDEPDALHMLGVICLQSGRPWEAFARMRRALERTDWAVPAMRHNLALVLPELLQADDAVDAIVAGDDPRAPLIAEARARLGVYATAQNAAPRATGTTAAPVSLSSRPRVLVVDHALPRPDHDSGSARIVEIMRLLVRAGCRVSFGARNLASDGPPAADLRGAGIEVVGRPDFASVEELIARRTGDFDVYWLSRYPNAVRYVAAIRRCAPGARVVFDTVDLHFLRERRGAQLHASVEGLRRAAFAREHELALARGADVTVVVSEIERALVLAEVPDADVRVIANVHCVRDDRGPAFATRRDFFFVGCFGHPPNVDAVRWYVEAVWPHVRRRLPHARTFVVGSNLPASVAALAGNGIVAVGHAPDLAPYLDGCRVSVAPLRYGAGVKGKIGTAQAAGVAVVATSVAVEGMHLAHGRDVLVADDAESFADAAVRLHEDESLWTAVTTNALRSIARHFSPAAAASALDELLQANMTRRPEASAAPRSDAGRAGSLTCRAVATRWLVLLPAGYGSLGDDAMVRGLLALAHRERPGTTIDLLSIYPDEPWPCVAGARQVLTARPNAHPPQAWAQRFRSMLARYDAFAVLGADVLDGHYSSDESRERLLLAQIAIDAGVPVSILGFSVNDHPDEGALSDLRALCARGTLRVRDPVSLRRLRERGLAYLGLVADLAFLMPPADDLRNGRDLENWIGVERAHGRTIVLFNLSSAVLKAAQGAGADVVLEAFGRLVADLIAEHDVSALLLPHDLREASPGIPGDVALAAALDERLAAAVGREHHAVYVPSNAPEVKRLAGAADLVVTGRMHLAIAALGMGTPVLGIGYQGKFEGLMEHFGIADAVIDAAAFDAAQLRSRCLDALARHAELGRAVRERLPRVIALAGANLDGWPAA